MNDLVLGIALAWAALLVVGGGIALLRSRDILERVLALDLLVAIVIALLALLSYWRGVPYYLDAALALALLSFVATLAAARHHARGGPFL